MLRKRRIDVRREWMGVEPTRAGIYRPTPVLKTGAATGRQPPPRDTLAANWFTRPYSTYIQLPVNPGPTTRHPACAPSALPQAGCAGETSAAAREKPRKRVIVPKLFAVDMVLEL